LGRFLTQILAGLGHGLELYGAVGSVSVKGIQRHGIVWMRDKERKFRRGLRPVEIVSFDAMARAIDLVDQARDSL